MISNHFLGLLCNKVCKLVSSSTSSELDCVCVWNSRENEEQIRICVFGFGRKSIGRKIDFWVEDPWNKKTKVSIPKI